MKFTGENILEFSERITDNKSCLAYRSELKWADGFICTKCEPIKFTVRKANFARDCNRCHHIESPTARTYLHKLRFGLRKAFGIIFEMSATTKSLSFSQIARHYGISQTTSWTFIRQLKSWLRTTYSRVHQDHLEKYLNEFSFRINRSIFKQTIFHSLVFRMIIAKSITYQMIKISN